MTPRIASRSPQAVLVWPAEVRSTALGSEPGSGRGLLSNHQTAHQLTCTGHPDDTQRHVTMTFTSCFHAHYSLQPRRPCARRLLNSQHKDH